MQPHRTAVCLMGPTASRKTEIAIALCKRFPCDIISVDSALVYRGMNIGTAKPDAATLASGETTVVRSWAGVPFAVTIERHADAVSLLLAAPGLDKRLTFDQDGAVALDLVWTPDATAAWLTTELSLSRSVAVETDAAGEWRHPIETVAKSERGLERTVQGEAVLLGWPVAAGRGRVRLRGGADAGRH